MEDMAKELGNPRVEGSIAVGVILKLFSDSLKYAPEVIRTAVREEFVEINSRAIERGYESVENRYPKQAGNYERTLNEEEDQRYGALVFGDICPLPPRLLKELAGRARRIVNIEQNATGQLAGLIREETDITCHDSIQTYDGRQITGGEIRIS